MEDGNLSCDTLLRKCRIIPARRKHGQLLSGTSKQLPAPWLAALGAEGRAAQQATHCILQGHLLPDLGGGRIEPVGQACLLPKKYQKVPEKLYTNE